MSDYPSEPSSSGGINRRELLARGAQGAAALGIAGVVAACGSTSTSTGTTAPKQSAFVAGLPTTSGTGTPVHGGTLTAAFITGGSTETLDPLYGVSVVDSFRALQLYDQLFHASTDLQTLVPRLAVSAEPNRSATVWTIKLRDGVTWHDGKPFTADDVIFNFKRWAAPGSPQASLISMVDFSGLRKRGDLIVEVPLLQPEGNFPALTAANILTGLVQNGATKASLRTNPVGTGPFKYQSFSPGQQGVFVANRDYWEHNGKPYVDKLVMLSSFTDENARLNALLSGQVDLVPLPSYLIAKQQKSAGQVTVFGSPSPNAINFPMRVDKGPLADGRVRTAMKLIADRQALIDGALAGFGTIGNDLLGQGAKGFASDLVRHTDIQQAKSLLKSAGRAGATFTLQTSPVLDGFTQAATLFAQQASAAGITVHVQVEPSATYFTSAGGFLSAPGWFRTMQYSAQPSLEVSYRSYLQPSGLSDSFWGKQPGGASALALMNKAYEATSASRATDLWRRVQEQQFNEGGLLVFGNAVQVNMAATHLKGVSESPMGWCNNGRLLDGWIAR